MLKKLFISILIVLFLSACTSMKPDDTFNKNEIDYEKLGFSIDFESEYELFDYWKRKDGVKNFLRDVTPTLLIENYTDPSSYENFELITQYKEYFIDSIYNKYYWSGLSLDYHYSVGIQKIDNEYRFKFYTIGVYPWTAISLLEYPVVDIIESNSKFSYVINYLYLQNDFNQVQEKFIDLFYVIYHDDLFPYRVYFDSKYIFLMSKDEDFDQTYISYFELNNISRFK